MKTALKAALAAASLMMAPMAASAATTFTMDFEELSANLGNGGAWTSYSFAGRTFGLSVTGHSEGANIFDTGACPTKASVSSTSHCFGDFDIVPEANTDGVSGNVLIRQRHADGMGDLANDAPNDGSIVFQLLSGPALTWLGASAIDNGTFTFSTDIDGTVTELGSVSMIGEKETSKLVFAQKSSLIEEGDKFIIHFDGSGAVDSLVFEDISVVPVPATLPLLVGALGGLGFMARRRKQRSA
jgi:hypothetical protein